MAQPISNPNKCCNTVTTCAYTNTDMNVTMELETTEGTENCGFALPYIATQRWEGYGCSLCGYGAGITMLLQCSDFSGWTLSLQTFSASCIFSDVDLYVASINPVIIEFSFKTTNYGLPYCCIKSGHGTIEGPPY